MNASIVAKHGLPNMSGYLARLNFSCKTINSIRYSQESNAITKYSITPSGLTVELSTNYRKFCVGLRLDKDNNCIVFLVITLIYTLKSIKLFLIIVPLILMSTTRLPGSVY